QFELHWSAGEIDRMVNARLRAYSDGTVQSFDELLDPDGPLPAFLRIYLARFSENSPRDMVRMLYRMLVEEERLRVGLGHRISTTAAIAGIQAACEERAQELIPEQMLNELRRLRRVDFTITELANDIFRITSPAMSNKIRTWETKGVVERVQDTRSTGSRPPNRYAISDVRVARVVMQNLDFFQFLNQKLAVCPTCDETLIRDWDEHTEHLCRCGANVQYVPR
ncbi:MAG: hypothetical protein KC472_10495, partial [Dehalococcoidia bacterium]|nr:hypothetical protein [Dehalococcoidia bacterium]